MSKSYPVKTSPDLSRHTKTVKACFVPVTEVALLSNLDTPGSHRTVRRMSRGLWQNAIVKNAVDYALV